MSAPPPMSIPISTIPIQKPDKVLEEDPEVLALLNDMQSPLAKPTSAPPSTPVAPSPQYYNVHQPPYYQKPVLMQRPYFDMDVAQKALYFVAIAFIVFYPQILDGVYVKMPSLESYRSYEMIARGVVLFIIVYIILYKFDNK